MALVVAFAGFFYRDLRRRRWITAALLIGGLVALALLETLGSNVIADLEANQFRIDQGRLDTYHSMFRMITDHPWFGTGLGTFVWSFPAYRSGSMWGTWDYAHSTPLELAGDLGLPLTGLIGLAWLLVLVFLIRGVRIRRSDRIVPAAGLAVAVLSLAHSFIDFSFQNPGYAIVVFALVGAGLAQSFSSNNVNGQRTNSVQNRGPQETRPQLSENVVGECAG
jgi:O-antigen ligase